MFIGVVIIVIGFLFLLESLIPGFDINFGIIWPLILIVIPINEFIKRKKLDLILTIVLFVGIWFLLLNLDFIPEGYLNIFWPIIIMLVGFSVAFSAVKISSVKKRVSTKVEASYYGIFSACDERINTNDFKGTNVYAIFGGVDLDLREVKLKDEEVVINAYSIFGGTTLFVPEGYNIVVNSTAILGGNDNKAHNQFSEKNKTIYINCVSVFGGAEIK